MANLVVNRGTQEPLALFRMSLSSACVLVWSSQSTSGGFRIQDHQRVNHFPNHVELTRKDLMAKNLKRAMKAVAKEGGAVDQPVINSPGDFEFTPVTFTLPAEGAMMLRVFKEKGGLWIMKPVSGRQVEFLSTAS
eukprot:5419412-Pyramimonas_sp.AAC.2